MTGLLQQSKLIASRVKENDTSLHLDNYKIRFKTSINTIIETSFKDKNNNNKTLSIYKSVLR